MHMEQLQILINGIKKRQEGQLLIEIILAIAITAIMLPALLTGLFSSKQGKAQQGQRVQAVALMKEAEEVVRNVREQGWTLFSVNGTYHPLISGTTWSFASGSENVNDLTRTITVSDVYRDDNGVVVTSGGSLDPSTKKVYIQITWGQPYASSVDSTIYITRYLQNNASTQTSIADFNAGTTLDTIVTNTSGGEITLAPNTKGKWCSPSFSSATITLPDGPPVAVAATASASSVSTPNDVFVATSPTTANSFKLAHVKVTADADPPVPTLRGTFTLDSTRYSNGSLVPINPGVDNSFITNAVRYYKSSSGKLYALLATTKPDREVIAVLVDDGIAGNDNTNNGEYQDYVNKIYKYWTYFDTKIYGPTSGLNTGFLNPTSNSADTGGDGNGFESNPTRAYSSNSSYATDSNSGNGNGTNCTGADKDKHRFYNYGISLPSGTTIDGIEIRLDGRADSTTGSPKFCIQLSWDGGTTWTSAKSTNNLTTNNATYTLGGSSDNWGRTWTDTELDNTNFRVRVIDIASSTRTFSLDWVATKVYFSGGTLTTSDQAPYGAGASSIAVLDDRGYVTSGGFLYVFDLSNIDSKSQSSGLDMIGCRIELDGDDCNTTTSRIRKYGAGNTGTNWGSESVGQTACLDGGNTQIYAENDIYPVKVGSNIYVYAAVGAGTDPELDIANVSTPPTGATSPSIAANTCGTIASGNASWKRGGSLDFNSDNNTQETANSVFASPDGTRAYISSNGTVDANSDGVPDSWQFYIINTTSKTSPAFLSGTPSTGATSGYYYGSSANAELYPRRSLTVFNGSRAIVVGKDGLTNGNNAAEYQVVNITNESSPSFCGSLDFNQGFSDLASVTEADNDKFAYLVSNTGVNELKIIQGGPDGTYLDTGTYESTLLDLGASVQLNRLTSNATVSASTTLQYRVAATLPVNGSCANATYTYVGPDGTAGTYFPSTGGAIPLSGISGFQNPAQCVRYKAYLSTTDFNVTPTLLDASINYSP